MSSTAFEVTGLAAFSIRCSCTYTDTCCESVESGGPINTHSAISCPLYGSIRGSRHQIVRCGYCEVNSKFNNNECAPRRGAVPILGRCPHPHLGMTRHHVISPGSTARARNRTDAAAGGTAPAGRYSNRIPVVQPTVLNLI